LKLLKTTLFSGATTFIKLSSGFVASKIIAVYTGPAGLALVGAFTNFISIALTFANGAINTGVVKFTAEFESNISKQKSLFSTSLKISLVCSTLVGTLLVFFSEYFSILIFQVGNYYKQFQLLGICILFYSLNSLLISILNGKGLIRSLSIVNALGSLVSLLLTIILVYFYKIDGALYALVLGQSVVFIITFVFFLKSSWFSLEYFKEKFNVALALKLSQFSLMAIVTALTVPVSQIVIRNLIISDIGIKDGGIWQGLLKISDGYLLLITTSLSTYYLPKLSSLRKDMEIKAEIINGYKLIIPAVFAGCLIIYFLRFSIINTLFSSDFFEMNKLFFWQLLGDFFKILAWVLAYLMLVKSMTKVYIATEIIFSLSYVLLSYLLMQISGVEGVVIAFAINYFIYLLVMLGIFRKLLLLK
jgi:PST family polysaccharide transporter